MVPCSVVPRSARPGGPTRLLGDGDAEAPQEARINCRRQRIGPCVRWRTCLPALVQRLGNKEHTVASGAPEVDHHIPLAAETDFEDSIRRLSAMTGKLHGAIAHAYRSHGQPSHNRANSLRLYRTRTGK